MADETSRGESEVVHGVGEAPAELGKAPGRRGPRRSLALAQVVDAALEVVDEGGPDALSVRAVAALLGVRPNALYTYVASRAALEREIVERVLSDSDVTLLDRSEKTWQQTVLEYATSLRTVLLRHPGVARLMMTAPMDGPTALLVGERLIAAIVDGGLTPADASRASYALIVQVLGAVALEVAETDGKPPLQPEQDRIAGRLAALEWLDGGQWPMTVATREVTAGWISTEQFVWSVQRLLDGIAIVR
ncbi:TetR/AcrR family transcriptional regulator C-terminal domain-containing protein [Nakamurella sp. GG22]